MILKTQKNEITILLTKLTKINAPNLFRIFILAPILLLPLDAVSQVQKKAPLQSAKRNAGASPQVHVNAQLTPYLSRLQSKLTRNWYLPDGNNHVTITATVGADGSNSDLITVSNPKSDSAENAAMDSFNKSLPLEPLPSGVTSGKLTLRFDSTADPHGDSKSNVGARFNPAPVTAPQTQPAKQNNQEQPAQKEQSVPANVQDKPNHP